MTKDVNDVMENPDSGLFWIPHESEEVNHGWAVVFACEGTPYYGGAFCFEVRFPDNYPFEPPEFTYLTNDGRTRFNPNLYKNGKVCLSLLNTWPGEKWSGVQTLTSVLRSIQSAVINEEPLVNEPSHPASRDSSHPDSPVYSRMVFHATLETAILGYLTNPPPYIVPIYDAAKSWAIKARPALVAKARALAAEWDGKVETLPFYSMTTKYKFAMLASRLEELAA